MWFPILFAVLFTAHSTYSVPHISVYGDVFLNKDFFTRTLPWIVDNLGGDLTIQYYMMGSGRHTVPQMCALGQLRSNSYIQAQYLKCEAEGRPSKLCLCEAGVDAQPFKECVRNSGHLASEANAQYLRLKIDALPMMELGVKNTIFGIEDIWYLKKICTLFLDDLPLGCVKPLSCNDTEVWDSRPGIAQIDRCCDSLDCSKEPSPSTTTLINSTPITTTTAATHSKTNPPKSTTSRAETTSSLTFRTWFG